MSKVKNFLLNRDAVGAVEFALILPITLILWIGVVETIELHLSGRKVTVAAQTTADLIAQKESVTSGELDDILAAAKAVMRPYPTSKMGFDFTSVEADSDGNVSIGWRHAAGTVEAATNIPERAIPLVTQDDSVIAVKITYTHEARIKLAEPIINFVMPVITEEAFARPRRTLKIPLN
tara:strand:+ start:3062 stop:3595 length:534 start_codon:yes stop_codon:yes gene_type:complete